MAKRDYYELLGVGRDASGDDLKKSYRKLAMKYHPDRNPGDEDSEHKFKELSEAYDVLRDGEKRAAYDQFGHAAVGGASFQITEDSGAFTLNAPGSGASGTIAAKTVENSNVDIATEFSNLIITQRAYSASAKIISTADQMLDELVRIKR